MVSTAIQVTQQNNGIQPARSDVADMIARFRAGLKGQDKLSDNELYSLGSMALAHGLDPFNGECWAIPGKGVMAGIKGLRKGADNQLAPGTFRNPSLRLLQHSEYDAYAIPEKAELAAICEMTRSDATQQWVEQFTALCAAMGDYNEALKAIGPRPVWVGIGIVLKGEDSRMTRIQLVFKRAEADATKRAFNLPFNTDLSRENGDASNAIEGEYQETSGRRDPQINPEAGGHAESIPGGTEPPEMTRPYDPETVRKGIKSRVEHNPTANEKTASDKQAGYVASLLNKAFDESATADKDRHAVMEWLVGKKSVKDLTAAEAKALIDWLADESGDLSYEAFQEANSILRAAMIEQGQIDMFDAALAETEPKE